ncbi:MAG TPA: 50S ribosomal protein L27 [Candidatus Omnitrophota bacterium]|nr:50S ribosomal protein L27 [Candidatus Omnitrophota bacterium]
MAGGKSTPKKDKKIKVSGGQLVKTGEILARGVDSYKAGANVKGTGTLYALCPGKILFSRKKSPRGSVKTYINIVPA